ncbi:hypothetical protein ABIB62_004748 [Mucilaginibacter sp. UYP25]|uniref:hypothetical protein n=1 Tax=unclassified Mucilaginibacter TaxID=2617802 RepID=UPI0033917068
MTKEQQFWDWFKENEAKYFFLNQINDGNEKERLLDDFLSHLHEYCDQLFFEVGGHPNEKQDLIITAEGDTDFFDEVETLVKKAPQLEYWNILAFKPVREDYITEYNNIKLDPKTMYFIPLNNNDLKRIGLRIYIDNYTSSNKEDFLTATYLVLDNLVGEKSNALDIGYMEIESLSSISNREELIELTKLPQYIKWKKSKP